MRLVKQKLTTFPFVDLDMATKLKRKPPSGTKEYLVSYCQYSIFRLAKRSWKNLRYLR